MNWKTMNPFHLPSADAMALAELENARRQLLAALSARDYAVAMVDYNTNRVRRLELRVADNTKTIL